MNENLRDTFMHWLTIAVLACVVVVGVFFAYPSYVQCQSLKAQEVELREKIESKKAEIAKLKDYQKRFKTDPDFVEAIARENRRVFPGELVFIFED